MSPLGASRDPGFVWDLRSCGARAVAADDRALLLIDHQTGTMLGVQDIRLDQFRSNFLLLASIGIVHNLPAVLTASYALGSDGDFARCGSSCRRSMTSKQSLVAVRVDGRVACHGTVTSAPAFVEVP